MNIPKREGSYTLNVGDNTIHINISYVSKILSRGEMISLGINSRVARHKMVPEYSVRIENSNGEVLDRVITTDEDKYMSFVSSFISKENGVTSDPQELMQKLRIKFQRETDSYVVDSKFSGIVKNSIKFVFYFQMRGIYDVEKAVEKLTPYFENLGIKVKIAPKKKGIRCWDCFVASLYLPLDFSLNENKNHSKISKKLIKLTESDIHRIVKRSVNRILREGIDKKLGW